jgi:preprotein translocase subunit SecD
VLAADVVALLAAVVLFWLSVGSVKGFALFLGLTTVCDLLVCYFFTRPATCLVAHPVGAPANNNATAAAAIGATS